MNSALFRIPIDHPAVAAFCRARGIRKLSLFGSVLREDFNPARSYLDLLVEFESNAHPGLRCFGYGEELAAILGRKVDFNTAGWLNRHHRDEVLREAVPIYEQTGRSPDSSPDHRVRGARADALRREDGRADRCRLATGPCVRACNGSLGLSSQALAAGATRPLSASALEARGRNAGPNQSWVRRHRLRNTLRRRAERSANAACNSRTNVTRSGVSEAGVAPGFCAAYED